MIHVGDSYTPLKEFLALMKKGDVVTHSFNSRPHGLLDSSGKLTPEVVEGRLLIERRSGERTEGGDFCGGLIVVTAPLAVGAIFHAAPGGDGVFHRRFGRD